MIIAICDDNLECIEKLKLQINCYFLSHKIEPEKTAIHTFQSGIDLLESFVLRKYDFVFLDIDMPAINGMELAGRIRQIDKQVQISFVTYMENQLPYGFRVMASGFVIKPFCQEHINRVMDDMISLMDKGNGQTLDIKLKGGGSASLEISGIMYIESFRHYMKAISKDGKDFEFYDKISNLENELASCNFARAHRSYLINLTYVFIRNSESIRLTSGILLPVGRSYSTGFNKLYDKFRQENSG